MEKRAGIGYTICKWVFLVLVVIFTIYPVVYAVLGSFKTNMELTAGGSFFPKQINLDNYIQAFTHGDFGLYTANSVVVSLITMALAVITSSLTGYTMARHTFPGRKILESAYLAFMFIALGSVTLYPLYLMLSAVGLQKTLLGMALVMTGGQASNVFLVMGFVRGVPRELDEAAYIDGCSYFRTFLVVIMPLLRPVLAVVALFAFRNAWNDYLTPMVMTIGNTKLRTLTVSVVQLKYSTNAAAEWNIMLAGACIALIPILLVYIFANKQFINGLTAGAVKG